MKARNIIWAEYSMEALYQCAKIGQSLQQKIRLLFALGLFPFYLKLWMYLTCQQQQKIS